MKPSIKLGDKYLSNSCQTMAYINAGLAGDCWKRCDNSGCCCADDDVVYVDPATDLADWYDPDNECSEDFFGLLLESVEYGDPYSVRVKDTLNGGFIQSKNLRAREVRVVAWLAGSSECGIQYGVDYVNACLSKLNCVTGECVLPDAEVVLCCDAGSSAKGTRVLKQVGAITPVVELTPDSDYRCCRTRVEFTLAAQVPYFFGEKQVLDSGLVFDDQVVCPNWCCGCVEDDVWPDCLEANSGELVGFTDSGAGGGAAGCYCEPVFVHPLCVPVAASGLFNDFVSWKLTAGVNDLVNVSVQYYESPAGVTTSPVDTPGVYACVDPDRVTAAFLPAGYSLIGDSTSNSVSVEDANGVPVDAFGVGGAASFVLGCEPGFLCVNLDTCNDVAGVEFEYCLETGTL